jgi:hypothetical protein
VGAILDSCQPRPEILAGTFNPEVFTASLSPIIDYYHQGRSDKDNIYTDAKLFFNEATYPTQGLKNTLAEVFGRIAGDATVSAIHRLETAFGGGKTHTLISCTHIAYKGTELRDVTKDIIDPDLLPEPGSVSVVGVAGDEIPVHKPKGDALIPYTLWGEIAYQIGGESLYREIQEDAESYAAPGKIYFEKVFGNRKALIMLDELAQYAARLEAARPDGANQLAAFLMGLHGHARNHPGISIILTLASAADAFSKQTEKLAKLITDVRGEDISHDDALGIGEEAVKGVASVIARDAVQMTPVQASEISSVLAKRLFLSVDRKAAESTAQEYMDMYGRNSSYLPEEASSENFKDRMIANYPFHPTLVDYLNKKLTDAENFQGTRGVLRVLALAVRSIWQKQVQASMIHACHLDLRSEKVVNEILGRTGSSDLLYVLNTDVGSVDTGTLEGGYSNAELADQKNPHPEGYPFYEYTWKTVFLHSLVGREKGMESNLFGLTESEALFAVSFPGLTPPQVRTALEEINESAFYLRFEQGKYFASEKATINSVLAKIRKTLSVKEMTEVLEEKARQVVKGNSFFHIETDVSLPEHLPDGKNQPILGVVSLTAESINVDDMVTTRGYNLPRVQQNLVFLLVPSTVTVHTNQAEQQEWQLNPETQAEQKLQYLENLARQVKAMRLLKKKPERYGLKPEQLKDEEFGNRYPEREQALSTQVAQTYTSLYFPSTSGHIERKEIQTAGGEGGLPFIEIIRELLLHSNELLTNQHTKQSDLMNLSQLFFAQSDTISLENLQNHFMSKRNWPILENSGVFEQLIRAGVRSGSWYVYRFGGEEGPRPEELYGPENEIPMGIDLKNGGYSIMKPQGVKQRGWLDTERVDPQELRTLIHEVVTDKGTVTVQQVKEAASEKLGEVQSEDFDEIIVSLAKNNKLFVTREPQSKSEKPSLIFGPSATLYTPNPDDLLVTPEKAQSQGWRPEKTKKFSLNGKEGAEKLLPLLRRIGSLYNKGAKSSIAFMDLVDLALPEGGTLRIQLENVSPESMKSLDEFFQVVDAVIEKDGRSEVDLEFADPSDDCAFIQELNGK